jgi:uncharacterized protein DUF3810
MVISGVKRKFPIAIALLGLALVTALGSWAMVFPPQFVERVYSRRVFPTISHIAGGFADSIPFSWTYVWILIGLFTVVFSFRRKNWRIPLGLASAVYLIFFWGWGLNYHRSPIEIRLGLNAVPKPAQEEVHQFLAATTMAVNRYWAAAADQQGSRTDSTSLEQEASARVREVIAKIDGTDWEAATRIKHFYPADLWFHAAGIDGVFNPFGHEPILVSGISSFRLPFVMAHELAHVHGIAGEGDANFVAFLACMGSTDSRFRYSASFEMWLHLGGSASDLADGPRQDLKSYVDLIRSQEIQAISRIQSAILDSHLKANGIQEGVQSYSKFVALAIGTRDRWGNFQ